MRLQHRGFSFVRIFVKIYIVAAACHRRRRGI